MPLYKRLATGIAVGAAALAVPFAASPASASDWEKAAGFPEEAECLADGEDYIENDSDLHDHTEFVCEQSSDGWWVLWVR